MPSVLYKNGGLVLRERVVQHWVPDPPTPYTDPYVGYVPPKVESISAKWIPFTGWIYTYKGVEFSSYEDAKAYRDGTNIDPLVVTGPGSYTPQVGYYYVNGKPATNMFYVRDPMTGLPITVKSALRRW